MNPLFDAHADTIFLCMQQNKRLRQNDLHTDLERGMAHSPYAQFFAIWGRPEDGHRELCEGDCPAAVLSGPYERLIGLLQGEFERNSDILLHCRCASDARRAAREGKAAAFISVEGAELLGCSEERLEQAYASGVRAVNLCWNYPNALCGTCMQEQNRGLSEAGRSFVRRAQALGVIVDLSHASEPAFWDTLELSSRPVMASHSNSKAVYGHPRNLTDEQFTALIQTGGVSGINLYSDFLSSSDADIDTVVAHIERFLSLGGEKAVAIGSDFDGIERPPQGISGIQDMHKLYEALLRQNYGEDLVRDIFYNNLMRVVEQAMN